MATVTHDGHSFSLDGRRIWVVSGTVHYARVPRELWRDRLLAARRAGLNCIETPIVWGLHEPHMGQLSFEGDLDIAAFLRLVGELGMHAIVRLGPYVGDGYDLGGLPSWIIPHTEGKLRTNDPAFLKASSQYISAVGAQIAPLQITRGGPLLLVQSEHEWFYGDDELAQAYLGELLRYIREASFDVPVLNRNNLYQSVEKEIGAWSGFANLHTITRQLRTVAPESPRIVAGLETGAPDVWGYAKRSAKAPRDVTRAIAEVLAGGGQFNLSPFHAGTHLAHHAGRLEYAPDAFMTTDADPGAPLSECGQENDHTAAVRRICLFASTFGRVFAHLDADARPIVVPPESTAPPITHEPTGERSGGKRPAGTPNVSVVPAEGAHGSVVFVFADAYSNAPKSQHCDLLLPDGSPLHVQVGEQGVAWVLTGAHLHGRATLDFSTLSALARVGRVFVCFGVAGSTGLVSINGSILEAEVPTGKEANILEHEDTTVVVLNEAMADRCYVEGDSVIVGALGLNGEGNPIATARQTVLKVRGSTGAAERVKGVAPATKPRATLADWTYSDSMSYVDGTTDRFATIDGPSSMEALGAPSGYGWMRLTFRSGAAKKVKGGFFESGDRLHVYLDAELQGVVGQGPGAKWEEVPLPLKRQDHTLTALVDNLGRLSGGSGMGEAKGLFGHVWDVAPFKAGAARLEDGPPLDPTATLAPFFGVTKGEMTAPARLTWKFKHLKKSPVILLVDWVPSAGLLVLNDEPVAALVPGCTNRFVLSTDDKLKRGQNVLQLAFIADPTHHEKELRNATRIFEGAGCVSDTATWAFAKWEPPTTEMFGDVTKTSLSGKAGAVYAGRPAWWRTTFEVSSTDVPLRLDASGLSKGAILLNGRALGRYFVATADGSNVPPQSTYYLPEPWLNADGPNELILFDEHGFTPDRVKLVYE